MNEVSDEGKERRRIGIAERDKVFILQRELESREVEPIEPPEAT